MLVLEMEKDVFTIFAELTIALTRLNNPVILRNTNREFIISMLYIYHKCSVDDCDYKCKVAGSLKSQVSQSDGSWY